MCAYVYKTYIHGCGGDDDDDKLCTSPRAMPFLGTPSQPIYCGWIWGGAETAHRHYI